MPVVAGITAGRVAGAVLEGVISRSPLSNVPVKQLDLAEALADIPGITVVSEASATISGYSGTLLDISSSDPDCAEGVEPLLLTTIPGYVDRPHPGDSDDEFSRWYILDVDGDRLVIQAVVPRGLPERVAADVDGMLQSVRIEVP